MILLPTPQKKEMRSGTFGGALEDATVFVDQALHPQGYVLQIAADRIEIRAGSDAGAFYARMTLRQMARQGPVPCCRIEDEPAIEIRGVMLDISRDKVPSMVTLKALVDRFSEWKINHLELYMEHTFAYQNHEVVWRDADPLTAENIRELDAYCKERFVDLVPNQNSLGHFHRWLKHDAYEPLAETPDGFTWPWGGHSDKRWSLCPTNPKSMELLRELYAQLLPNFSSKRFNVGCDEPFDVGQGRSAKEVAERGKGAVYLDHVLAVHRLVTEHDRKMMFWGDVLVESPEVAAKLPKDITVLEWGYEADHPFEERAAALAQTGLSFFLCPGTSSWNTIAGRTDNALGNLSGAATAGKAHGAKGFLNTDWGDNGHRQYLPVSYLGFAAGAALSWSPEPLDWAQALDVHVFQDAAGVLGAATMELGQAYQMVGKQVMNQSVLFNMLRLPPAQAMDEGVTVERLRATMEHVRAQLARLSSARPGCSDGKLLVREFQNAGRMQLHALVRGAAHLSGTLDVQAADLKKDMREILAEHKALWAARNRMGGFKDSVEALSSLYP